MSLHPMGKLANLPQDITNKYVSWTEPKTLSSDEQSQLEEIELMTEGSLLTINSGIAAIGEVLANIGSYSDDGKINEDLLSASNLTDIGYLLEGLGHMALSLNGAVTSVEYIKQQQTRLNAAVVIKGER